jgi:ABC-2 type transport system permease protein
MGALRTVLEIARQTAALQLQNRLFRLLPLAMLAAAALVFLVGMDPPHSLSGRKLFAVVSWWLLANVLLPWTTMYFGVQAVHGDVEDRTFQYLFLRPVPRWAIFVGKCLAVAGLSALAHAVGMGLVFFAGSLHEDMWSDGLEWDLLFVFMQACALLGIAYAAVAGFFGAWFKRPLVWSAAFILFGQVFLANLPAKAGIRHATIADPVRRFVFDRVDLGDNLSRALWPAERNFTEDLIGEPLWDLSVFVAVALALGILAYVRSEYDSRERE